MQPVFQEAKGMSVGCLDYDSKEQKQTYSCQKTVSRGNWNITGVEKHEASGTVGVLAFSLCEAFVTDESSLLVTNETWEMARNVFSLLY
jgi:hypothetical protein